MADYAGNPTFGENIYLVETSDAVLGGIDGVANLPAKNLADRTQYLKRSNDRMIGLIADFAAIAAPDGFLECDGSRILRATYADLFAVTSLNWGLRFDESVTPNQFESVDRVGDTVTTHPFNTGDAVNVKQTNADSTAVIQDGGVDVAPDDVVYVRRVDANNFTLHPTALDATNNTNALSAVNFDALNGFVIEYDDQFSLPDLRGRVAKGVSASTADYSGKEARIEPAAGASDIVAHSLIKCIKFE